MIASVEVPVSANGRNVTALLDMDDYLALDGRKLSLGSHGYPQIFAGGKVQTLHRWLLGLTGRGYSVIVDHINRDQLDNRRSNLRAVDPSTSNANRIYGNNSYSGVSLTRSGKWQAKFRWRKQRHYVGTFSTQEGAAEALRAYRKKHCPESLPPIQS
ncbi:HNH endonuclease [Actinopolyspora halophila]|uniref:HNH endonuclease n=1 Tax=Actinopolyspora halophila TaxID=1850 RepID=UPI00036CBB78|nr:AP2 domain-containing protein [Actinopolyspora halophila]